MGEAFRLGAGYYRRQRALDLALGDHQASFIALNSGMVNNR